VSDVTRILQSIDAGDSKAAKDLLPLVYDELRRLATYKMAQERPGQTLQATALVHEAWLRVAGSGEQCWNSRAHFFGAAAEAMRRILIEAARRKARIRHGGKEDRLALDTLEISAPEPDDRMLMVDEALSCLTKEAPQAAEVVKLRYFAGLTNQQVAELLNTSLRSVERQWTWAKAWLFDRIRESRNP